MENIPKKIPTLDDVYRYYYPESYFKNGKIIEKRITREDSVIHDLILGFYNNFNEKQNEKNN